MNDLRSRVKKLEQRTGKEDDFRNLKFMWMDGEEWDNTGPINEVYGPIGPLETTREALENPKIPGEGKHKG